MKQTYKIIGLDCANCALSLEKKIKNVNGVQNCNINFLGEQMNIEFEGEVLEEVKDICANFEDGVALKRIK